MGSSGARKRRRDLDSPLRIAHKKIKLRQYDSEIARKISEQFNLQVVTGKILAARGFEPNVELENFLAPSLKSGLPAPENLLNLHKACELINEIVEAGSKIAICCDFDVDGLSGGSQVYSFFRSIDVPCEVFVPCRFTEGYGLHADTVRTIAERGFELIITIDFGTTNENELALARELGLKTIVIDHHHVGSKRPPADVFVNPMQPGCGFASGLLCAAGLAWYLIAGLRRRLARAANIDPRTYLDLACLGTICDMVPLVGANRVIAKRGMELLEQTTRPGLLALKKVSAVGKRVSCTDISFGLGPRINAAGRMVHGEVVIELLATEDRALAARTSKRLDQLNQERKAAEEYVKALVIEQLEELGSLPPALVFWDAQFHTGVVGIVAQRLVELYYRPTAIMGIDEHGMYKGSVRGIKGFSVIGALSEVGDLLEKFGGHEGAGGFSLNPDNAAQFKLAFETTTAKHLAKIEVEPYISADSEVSFSELSIPLVEELRCFAPLGVGNPGPVLLTRNLEVQSIKVLKHAHLKVQLSDGKQTISGLMWRITSHPDLVVGARVDVAFKPDVNNFGGYRELQLNIQGLRGAA